MYSIGIQILCLKYKSRISKTLKDSDTNFECLVRKCFCYHLSISFILIIISFISSPSHEAQLPALRHIAHSPLVVHS